MNRKEFLHTAGRYGILALLALMAAFLLTQRKTTGEGKCTNDFACNGCDLRNTCSIKKPLK